MFKLIEFTFSGQMPTLTSLANTFNIPHDQVDWSYPPTEIEDNCGVFRVFAASDVDSNTYSDVKIEPFGLKHD